jgi:peroxiredoxin
VAATASTMIPLGTAAPDFHLPDTSGLLVSRDDFAPSPALLVMFLCNHCPYVRHVAEETVRLSREYQARGVGVVAISSNDVAQFPEDGPARMREVAAAMGFTVPYLYDETQEVARAYHAACTPDFFLFDADRRLSYRGQLDGARPGNDVPVSGRDLRAALDAVLAGKPVPEPQTPSLGCSIK